jgi:lysozyme
MSNEGMKLLQQLEGCSLVAYPDSGGIFTIGFGNTKYLDGSPVKEGDKIDMALAIRLFEETVKDFEKQVRLILDGLVLPEICIDSLVIFAYNVGCSAFCKSTLLKKIKSDKNNLQAIETEFLKWNKVNGKVVKGLTNRRKKEFDLYKKGILNQYSKSEIYDKYVHKCNLK